jgi:hypothetical protein
MASPYSGMTRYERSVLSDVKGHEIAHREFFRNALGSSRIPELGITFPSVDFSNRDCVLRTASMFEDLSASAYKRRRCAADWPEAFYKMKISSAYLP